MAECFGIPFSRELLTLSSHNLFIHKEFNILVEILDFDIPPLMSCGMHGIFPPGISPESPPKKRPPDPPRMKMKIPLIVALAASIPAIASGFTLDAVGYDGFELSLNPLSVFVPGYGELIFEAAPGTAIMVSSAYGNDGGFGGPLLDFDQDDAVKITFNGHEPKDGFFDLTGAAGKQGRRPYEDLFTPQAFLVTYPGDGESTGPGKAGPDVDSIPELASAFLGLIGTAVFAFRRRR